MSMSARTSSSAPNPVPAPAPANSNRWSTKQLVTMALMCAISLVLTFVEFVIFPNVPFLKLDVSLVPSAVVGFAYGPVPGIVVGLISAVGHAAITGNWVGAIMNVIVTIAFIAPSSLIYKRFHTFKGAIVSLVVGALVVVGISGPANLIVDPLLYGVPMEMIMEFMPFIIAFNAIKGVLIAVLTGVVYKSISNLITSAKDQVKGR